ncbi:MAG: cation diffusion facilitator family transporter [Clostridiales bacterium]|nr:cation diffusion facilitator family transporter [Clostridiales bacterium]
MSENIVETNESKSASRQKTIVRTSILGIAANILLAGFKAAVGLISNSISVTLDAVNNLSDALSSVITIAGTKLANKKPDKKHPFGHGRIEYLTATLISIIVLYAGITSLVESIKKIITPVQPDYSTWSLIIIGVAVVVKIFLGLYVKKTGKAVNSDSLIASGTDALMDAIISTTTLVAALIFVFFKVGLEAYLGAAISIYIIRSGFVILKNTLSQILGERADKELTTKIKKKINSIEGVNGTYDLVLNNYGPEKTLGSVHVEVNADMTVQEIDQLQKEIQYEIYSEFGVIITAVGIYCASERDEVSREMKKFVYQTALSYPNVKEVHGFYYNKEKKHIRFDVVIGFESKDRIKELGEIAGKVKEKYPDCEVLPVLDDDISD